MKKFSLLLGCLLGLTVMALAQEKKRGGLGGLLDRAGEVLKSGTLTQDDIAQGLKEALTVGIRNGSAQASARDGYWGNALIRIGVPPEVQRVEATLRRVGLGQEVDRFLLAMNRGAEDAAKQAAPIFVDAIRQMTIQDAVGILRGEKDAATQYLKRTSSPKLMAAFTPIIDSSLAKTNATRYYTDLATAYNRLPLVQQKLNPDLTAYATQKAMDGLYTLVAQEEAKIRENPQARVSELLRRVFGSTTAASGGSGSSSNR
jgi:hypothetical protein